MKLKTLIGLILYFLSTLAMSSLVGIYIALTGNPYYLWIVYGLIIANVYGAAMFFEDLK